MPGMVVLLLLTATISGVCKAVVSCLLPRLISIGNASWIQNVMAITSLLAIAAAKVKFRSFKEAKNWQGCTSSSFSETKLLQLIAQPVETAPTKIGSKLGGAPTPKMVPLVLTHSQMASASVRAFTIGLRKCGLEASMRYRTRMPHLMLCQAMRRYTTRHIARIYPAGYRVDSSNYDPQEPMSRVVLSVKPKRGIARQV